MDNPIAVYVGLPSAGLYVSYMIIILRDYKMQTLHCIIVPHKKNWLLPFSPQLFDVVGSCVGQPSCTEKITKTKYLVYSVARVPLLSMM